MANSHCEPPHYLNRELKLSSLSIFHLVSSLLFQVFFFAQFALLPMKLIYMQARRSMLIPNLVPDVGGDTVAFPRSCMLVRPAHFHRS